MQSASHGHVHHITSCGRQLAGAAAAVSLQPCFRDGMARCVDGCAVSCCGCSVPTGGEDPEACYICFDVASETGRELMPSPCACKKPVHRSCLSKWIATKGSRLCSICKGKLPIDFTVDPPFVVLQVCCLTGCSSDTPLPLAVHSLVQ